MEEPKFCRWNKHQEYSLTVTANHSLEKTADVQDAHPSRREMLQQTSQAAENPRLQFPKFLTRGSCAPAAAVQAGPCAKPFRCRGGTQLTQESSELRQLSAGSWEGWSWAGTGTGCSWVRFCCRGTAAWHWHGWEGKYVAVRSSRVGRDPIWVLENRNTFGLTCVSEVWT